MAFRLYLFYACAKATMASFKASHPRHHDHTLVRTGGRKGIARCPCTPQGSMGARSEKINASSGPSKEIAGLKKMMKKMMMPGSQDSGVGILA